MITAGTGHRPEKLGGYTPEAEDKVVQVLMSWLQEFKPDKSISGLALGFDQALVRASVNLNIPVLAAVPFEGQEANWPLASRIAYKALLKKCSQVKIISPGEYSANKMQKRNIWMVDQLKDNKFSFDKRGDVLLTIFDGSAGGTKNCLDYAYEKSKTKKFDIVNLYDRWLQL